MANLHFALACLEVERLEWVLSYTDLQRATILSLPRVQNGMLVVADAPGLGIQFDPGIAERFPWTPGLAERASGMIVV